MRLSPREIYREDDPALTALQKPLLLHPPSLDMVVALWFQSISLVMERWCQLTQCHVAELCFQNSR